jgi:hypothetical protein
MSRVPESINALLHDSDLYPAIGTKSFAIPGQLR